MMKPTTVIPSRTHTGNVRPQTHHRATGFLKKVQEVFVEHLTHVVGRDWQCAGDDVREHAWQRVAESKTEPCSVFASQCELYLPARTAAPQSNRRAEIRGHTARKQALTVNSSCGHILQDLESDLKGESAPTHLGPRPTTFKIDMHPTDSRRYACKRKEEGDQEASCTVHRLNSAGAC
jgi:hypothetical protein